MRASWRDETPIEWTRVHKLPDFVFFNHSIHVNKGIGCATCHGPVDKMPLMYQANTLRMGWCLQCHRNPEQFIRPREQVLNMNYDPATDETLDQELNVSKADADKFGPGCARRKAGRRLPRAQRTVDQLLHLSPVRRCKTNGLKPTFRCGAALTSWRKRWNSAKVSSGNSPSLPANGMMRQADEHSSR